MEHGDVGAGASTNGRTPAGRLSHGSDLAFEEIAKASTPVAAACARRVESEVALRARMLAASELPGSTPWRLITP
jgi:hypothetical protein